MIMHSCWMCLPIAHNQSSQNRQDISCNFLLLWMTHVVSSDICGKVWQASISHIHNITPLSSPHSLCFHERYLLLYHYLFSVYTCRYFYLHLITHLTVLHYKKINLCFINLLIHSYMIGNCDNFINCALCWHMFLRCGNEIKNFQCGKSNY